MSVKTGFVSLGVLLLLTSAPSLTTAQAPVPTDPAFQMRAGAAQAPAQAPAQLPRDTGAAAFQMPALPAARATPPAQVTSSGPFRLERPAAPVPASQGPAQARNGIDESALRFYASQNDTARVAAEVRRLRSLYPDWQPSADLFTAPGERIDEQPLWDVFATGQLDEVRAMIAQVQAERPGYQPSAELQTRLRQAETRQSIVQASEAKDFDRVIEIAQDANDMLVCREMDVMWRVAEALIRNDDAGRGLDLYRFILRSCDNPGERLATVQKAMTLLPVSDVEQLIAMGRRRAGGASEFEVVRLDMIRRVVGEAASTRGSEAAGERELRALEQSARRGRHAGDAELLGWYHYNRRDFTKAREFFRLSLDARQTPKAMEGLILAMREMGATQDAEALAFAEQGRDPMIRKLYVELVSAQLTATPRPAIDPVRLRSIQETVEAERSALGAQSIGWYLYTGNNARAALGWFEKSVAYEPTEAGVLGLAISLHRLGESRRYAAVTREYREQFPAIAALSLPTGGARTAASGRRTGGGGGGNTAERQIVRLYEAGRYQEALAAMDRQGAGLSRGMQTLRGWAQVNAGQYAQAVDTFRTLDRARSSTDTRHGRFVAEAKNLGHDSRTFHPDN